MFTCKQFFEMLCPKGSEIFYDNFASDVFLSGLARDLDTKTKGLDIGLDVEIYSSPCCDKLIRLFSFKKIHSHVLGASCMIDSSDEMKGLHQLNIMSIHINCSEI